MQEPSPSGRSPQEERQVENTDGAAQCEDSGDRRCYRKPFSLILHGTLLRSHVQGHGIPQRPPAGSAAPHASVRDIHRRGPAVSPDCAAQTISEPLSGA
jgi:hypothetical protein